MVTANHILQSFKNLTEYQWGELNQVIKKPASIESSESNILIYLSNEKFKEQIQRTPQKTIVLHKSCLPWAQENLKHCTVFTSPNPMLAMALINNELFPRLDNQLPFDKNNIHPTSVIHPSVKLGENVIVGPNTVIGENTVIGNNTIIGSNTTIERNVKIGNNCHIYSQVFIGFGTAIGNSCEIQANTTVGTNGFGLAHNERGEHIQIPHYGNVIFEDRVQVGSNNSFDRGTFGDTVIGEGTKIDNKCHFAHNFKIGKNSIITAGFIVAGSTEIGDNFVCGGRTNVSGHVKICSNVQLAALTTVTKDITEPGNYAGYPFMKHTEAIKYQALLPSLPEMRKTLTQLKKKLLDT